MPLTEAELAGIEPRTKRFRISDGGGLFIEISPTGSKTWKLAYRFNGKQRSSVLGVYPELGLERARRFREEAKVALRKQIDPFPKKRTYRKKYEPKATPDTWVAVAREYRDRRIRQGMADLTRKKMEILLEKTLPSIGSLPVAELKPTDLLPILREQEALGYFENASRLRTLMGQIFRFAVATGRAERDVTQDLKDALLPPKPKHHAAITDPKEVGGLMRSIKGYHGDPAIKAALQLIALTFTRPGELRMARWDEFEGDTWTIPEARMKSKRKHVVPLSRQAREVLEGLRPITEPYGWLFPQKHQRQRAISAGALNSALRRMGYNSDEHVPHGFRTMASTNLNENGWNPDWVEAQLAHVPRNKVRAAYNAAQYLDGRREMMQWWANWLDEASDSPWN
ncbi:tyrosine-type recombinase/integrase [Ruegeria sp. R14_0]|uniref:tyrosine-type recombinase/integrase n=1 Tax=Ruegeria sp. R14_0 TaxID=2821100 RepID=UPI001AD9FFFE|nr:tyrosine-type recombinase/integrase [Ruegeria sp. R14_0]MBO9447268.1 tyrosine-type recombinase/integrase [Ruegeria sp. R14_0]